MERDGYYRYVGAAANLPYEWIKLVIGNLRGTRSGILGMGAGSSPPIYLLVFPI